MPHGSTAIGSPDREYLTGQTSVAMAHAAPNRGPPTGQASVAVEHGSTASVRPLTDYTSIATLLRQPRRKTVTKGNFTQKSMDIVRLIRKILIECRNACLLCQGLDEHTETSTHHTQNGYSMHKVPSTPEGDFLRTLVGNLNRLTGLGLSVQDCAIPDGIEGDLSKAIGICNRHEQCCKLPTATHAQITEHEGLVRQCVALLVHRVQINR